MKLKSAQEDTVDLQTEFELERQGYLDTVRHQVCVCIIISCVCEHSHKWFFLLGSYSEAARAAAVDSRRSRETRL